MTRIWLIGGTQESARIARSLAALALPCLITVTTEAARSLYPTNAPLQSIWVGRLSAADLDAFLRNQSICAIVDASHPFAVEISQLAIAIAQTHTLPYLRFERSRVDPDERSPHEYMVPSLETLLVSGQIEGQRVLFTLGYRMLSQVQPWQHRATLFARILPSITALEAALQAGFDPSRLIALRPPISLELERSLWQHWQLSMVVTKASGVPGGELIKRQLAQELGVTLVTIARPELPYPQWTSEIPAVIKFCQAHVTAG